MIDPFRTGRIVEFEAEYDSSEMWRLFELVNFALIGVIGVSRRGLSRAPSRSNETSACKC